ncbi:SUMF1/EgtB/PvdO family nonheme iron enzyme [Saccharopolyspora taberi]|uniref:Protein kinase domain-containing protein n=1 Tax=Saccharopolyspora taberi TaxID=60895 RepID=A0ABN3VG67_9PSEU
MGLYEGRVLSTGETVVEVRHGGFAEVGVLDDEFEGRKKVVKRLSDRVLETAGKAVADSFFHECKTVFAKLEGVPHVAPSILAMRNLDDLGPVLFVSYVDGPALRELIRAGRQSLTQTVRMGGQIARAVAGAHDRDVRHRDLKPSNILLTTGNEIRLIDWGLSRAQEATELTVGVVDYLSPERREQPILDAAPDDVHALGVILHECLTGGYPDTSAGPVRLRAGLAAARAFAPARLLDLVCGMLDPRPQGRPTARDAATALTDPVLVEDITAREVEDPFCRKCGFVAADAHRSACPVCDHVLYARFATPPRAGMVRIPPGVYIQGIDQNQARQALMAAGIDADSKHLEWLAPPDDQPKEVFVPGFDIDVEPVTNLAYAEFAEATNYPAPEGLLPGSSNLPDHPVVHVTWRDALCYALWAGKRLPRPQEWEKAARGDRDNRTYPWGDVWQESRCNHSRYSGNQFPRTNPVGAFTSGESDGRSPFGVAGMAGNVSEWVSHSKPSHAQGRDARMRAVCGGGWSDPVAVYGAVSVQLPAEIDYESPSVGFRCVADIVYEERRIDEIGS